MADFKVNTNYTMAIAIVVSALLISVVFGFRAIVNSQNAALVQEVATLKSRLEEVGVSDYIKEIGLVAAPEEEKMDPIITSDKTVMETDFERYVRRSTQPGLFQFFRSGDAIYQRNIEGLEYIDQITFEYHPRKRTVTADIFLRNDTSKRALPKFQILLFDGDGKLIAEESVLFISEFLSPNDTKLETMKFKIGGQSPNFFEVKELE